ncbi:MAG TPA: CoA-acylating methylmalonate-semialdehyde dehydrogenase [Acidobacteriota bacterium]|nr:CoA-acylating methylmalonate-semialdehyde dehydrogenase [Acidobacteriota bacterium]
MTEICGNFIDGKTVPAHASETTPVFNPSRGEVIAETPVCGDEDAHCAVLAAREAFPGWAATPPNDRCRILFRYHQLLESNFEALARQVVREHGKTFEEACGDVRRGIDVVEMACGIPSLLTGQHLDNVARAVDGTVTRQPIGVCAGITPFNFPAMVPMWMFPLALACGNTFVLKPSPKVPLTAIRLAELAAAAGLPHGVFNVIHGGKEVVDVLLRHPDVAAISFVGSTRIAKCIYETGAANGKRVQAAGGAKNHMIVMPDADMDATVSAIMGAAFGCTGQRCMAGSVAVAVGDIGDLLLERLSASAAALRIGPTDQDDSVAMGPMIDSSARDRVLHYLDLGVEEGAVLAVDGRNLVPRSGCGFFVGPSIFDHVKPGMRIARDEIFGPVLSLMRAPSLDDAIITANRSPYGNGAVIFTGDGAMAGKFAREVQSGMVGINVGVPAPMALFPFSGWNQSFFGDLHVQGQEGIQFFTRARVVLTRWGAGRKRGTWS